MALDEELQNPFSTSVISRRENPPSTLHHLSEEEMKTRREWLYRNLRDSPGYVEPVEEPQPSYGLKWMYRALFPPKEIPRPSFGRRIQFVFDTIFPVPPLPKAVQKSEAVVEQAYQDYLKTQ